MSLRSREGGVVALSDICITHLPRSGWAPINCCTLRTLYNHQLYVKSLVCAHLLLPLLLYLPLQLGTCKV